METAASGNLHAHLPGAVTAQVPACQAGGICLDLHTIDVTFTDGDVTEQLSHAFVVGVRLADTQGCPSSPGPKRYPNCWVAGLWQ